MFLPGSQQLFDHLGQAGDLRVDLVDAGEHGLEQAGVVVSEELRPFQGLLQLADLAAGAAAGQLREHPGVAMAGDQVAHDVPAGDAVQV